MDPAAVKSCIESAVSALESGDPGAAVQALSTLAQVEARPETAAPIAFGLLLLANLEGNEGGAKKMLPLLGRAHQIGHDFPEVVAATRAEIAMALAAVHMELGAMAEAKAALELGVEQARQCKPANDALLAQGLFMLAGFASSEGDTSGVEPLLAECASLSQKGTAAEAMLPMVLSQQAEMALAAGSLKMSVRLLEHAAAAADEAWDLEDPRLAALLTGLAMQQLGLPDANEQKLMQHLERARAIVKRIHGEEHFEVARVLNAMGRVLIKFGKADEALPLLAKALWIHQSVEPNSLALADAHNTMGTALYEDGSFTEALEHFEAALQRLQGDEELSSLHELIEGNRDRAQLAIELDSEPDPTT